MASELLKEFVEKFKTMKRSGSFTAGGSFFAVIAAGKGALAYRAALWNGRPLPGADERLELAAARDAEGGIHVMRAGRFGRLGEEDLPDGARFFSRVEIGRATGAILADMFDALPTYGVKLSAEDAAKAEEAAWLLALDPDGEIWSPSVRVTADDAIDALLGLKTAEGIAKGRFEEERDEWAARKAVQEKALELSMKFVDDEEVKIYRSLAGVAAKGVSVTFEKEGQRASARCDPQDVRRIIRNRRSFSPYGDFSSSKAGEALYEKIFHTRGCGSANQLTPSDVVKITRGKTVLYERSEK